MFFMNFICNWFSIFSLYFTFLLKERSDELKEMEDKVYDFWYLKTRGWFMRNPDLQAKLLEVVRRGLGEKVVVSYPEFEEHLDGLLKKRSDELKEMEDKVYDFWYLKTRGWFMRNPGLQAKLLEVVGRGMGDKVVVSYPEFEWHLENLLSGGKLALEWMEEEVPDFYYLKERSWFMKSPSLQAKLLEVVRRCLGHRVNVVAPEFEEHLDTLLSL
jgi:hypothetical protein